MTLSEAKAKAILVLGENKAFQEKYHPVILDEHTKETEFGWVFYYQSYDFIYRGIEGKMLIGNGPIMIDKDFDLVFRAGTRCHIDEYVSAYMKNRGNLDAYECLVNSLP